jgi:hypothetical protein
MNFDFSAIYAWIMNNLSLGWVFIVWIALTILGTIIDAVEKIIAASPSKDDDEKLAKIEASWYAKIILAICKPFSIAKNLQASGGTSAVRKE